MLSFLFGVLIGLSIGYPIGLWAMEYNLKEENNNGS
jgi:hypothetical protein